METKKIHKAYKFRIYPTSDQREYFQKIFSSTRTLYNDALSARKKAWEERKERLSRYELSRQLTLLKKKEQYSHLNEIPRDIHTHTLIDFDSAYDKFFKGQNRYPKYKNERSRKSFTTSAHVQVIEDRLYFTGFRKENSIKMKVHREIEGRILSVTISVSPTGKYYASLPCEIDYTPVIGTESMIGIDTGIKDFAILSDGTKYENKKHIDRKTKELKYRQRQLSKKKKGSKNRRRAQHELAITHEKVANSRRHYQHEVSRAIVNEHSVMVVEDLAVKNMLKNHKIAIALSDVGLGTFYSQLEYKSAWDNKRVLRIGRFYPSSKTCHICGHIKEDLRLRDRVWTCTECGSTHDRDTNAAKNIKREGERILLEEKISGCVAHSEKKQKRGKASEPVRNDSH